MSLNYPYACSADVSLRGASFQAFATVNRLNSFSDWSLEGALWRTSGLSTADSTLC